MLKTAIAVLAAIALTVSPALASHKHKASSVATSCSILFWDAPCEPTGWEATVDVAGNSNSTKGDPHPAPAPTPCHEHGHGHHGHHSK